MKQRSAEDYIPFSWTLLFIALLHVSSVQFSVDRVLCSFPSTASESVKHLLRTFSFASRTTSRAEVGLHQTCTPAPPRGLGVSIPVPEEAFILKQLDRFCCFYHQHRESIRL